MWVVYGGAVFSNYIALGDPHYPEYPYGFLDKFHPTHAGVDWNGEITGHYLIKIAYDDNFVYVLSEDVFWDLNEIGKLCNFNRWFDERIISLEVEDGLYNIPFANDCRRLGYPAIYKQWGGAKRSKTINIKDNEESDKMVRISALKKRTIIIDKLKCPITYKNLQEAAYDQNSRLPKLEKRTDQHGLDGLMHAIHESGGKIHFRKRYKKDIFGKKTKIYNPIQHI